jgi:hypothetical protein
MLHLRITTPSELTDQVVDAISGDPAVSQVAVLAGAAVQPPGDIVLVDVAREAANELIDRLDDLGVPQRGTIHAEPVKTWVSRAGFDAERQRHTPGSSADAVVWADVTQRAFQESELNLDVPGVHDARDPARLHRNRGGLPDPGHRRHGPGPRVRGHRRPRPRPGTPARLPVGLGHDKSPALAMTHALGQSERAHAE